MIRALELVEPADTLPRCSGMTRFLSWFHGVVHEGVVHAL
jgi:hypothetical protein